jgi:glycine/D-amino acid oxidase-like deaminating enzyme
MSERCNALVIGGGFYGLYLAEYLRRRYPRVVVCERDAALMRRASYNNQARVHHGYHYPRSILTAARSRMNFPRFVDEFRPAIDAGFEKIYAIARNCSKTSASQFVQVMQRVGAPIEPAGRAVARLFDREFVEEVFRTVEYAFDATKLREIMVDRLAKAGVEIRLETLVSAVDSTASGLVEARLVSRAGEMLMQADCVFCCAYAQLNQPTAHLSEPPLPLKHEYTELALVEVPSELAALGITIMDGPFFSCMPFPAKNLHSLSHVRYTPHVHWFDGPSPYRSPYDIMQKSAALEATGFPFMVRDAARYLPLLAKCRYRESLWEVKTILPRSEMDDSRPILLRLHHAGIRNYHLVMGAKIDNVYDVLDVIDKELV